MNKQILPTLKISLLAIVLSFGISYAIAWTAPTATPPTGNVSAPINTGATDQTKAGDLCTTKGGTTKCLSTAQFALPGITLTATPSSIQNGQTSTLSWTATNSTSCTASNSWSGSKATSSSETTVALSGPLSYTFTLTCTGSGGPSSKDVVVQVIAAGSSGPITGTGVWYTIPAGVNKVTFTASGGRGLNGGGSGDYCYDGSAGGGGAGAYYGANIPIVVVGGGGGGGVCQVGAAGGTTAGSGVGIGALGYFGGTNNGVSGSAGSGGRGGNKSTLSTGGGAGGVNGATGGTDSLNRAPGGGGSTGLNGGSAYDGAGGGGGYGGGGGGYSGYSCDKYGYCSGSGYGGGGGGGSYAHPSLSAASASGRSITLSSIGNPTQIYLVGGLRGVGYGYNSNLATSGTITMSW